MLPQIRAGWQVHLGPSQLLVTVPEGRKAGEVGSLRYLAMVSHMGHRCLSWLDLKYLNIYDMICYIYIYIYIFIYNCVYIYTYMYNIHIFKQFRNNVTWYHFRLRWCIKYNLKYNFFFNVIFVATNMEELSHCCQVLNPVEFERPYCEVTVT